MKRNAFFIYLLLICQSSFSQIEVSKLNGGSVQVKLGYELPMNKNSSLTRECITFNELTCPIKLHNYIVSSEFYENKCSFKAKGDIEATELIVAYKIEHVVFDVFGEYIATLVSLEVSDISSLQADNFDLWFADKHQVKSFLTSVSYVSEVRKANGDIWKQNSAALELEFSNLKLKFKDAIINILDEKR